MATVPRVIAGVLTALGLLVLAGWVVDIPALKSILPGFVTMKVNTALAFFLSGGALWLLSGANVKGYVFWIGETCALIVAAIGAVTLAEYILGTNIGIDQLLIREDVSATYTSHPGRMSAVTAANFLMLGASLMLLGVRRAFHVFQSLTFLISFVGLLNITAYFYGMRAIYPAELSTAMALHTAGAFILTGAGLLWARPDRGFVGLVRSDTAGGQVLRWSLLPTVVVTLFLGWLRLRGEQAGLYGTEFGVAFFRVFTAALMVFMIAVIAEMLRRFEIERRRSQEELARYASRLEAANKELEAFSYSVSHDLRAPLRHVSGYVDLLGKRYQDALAEKGRHYLNAIADSVRQMGLLIDDLLQFSRTGRMEMRRSDLDMNGMLREAQVLLRHDNPGRNIEWIIADLPPVHGDHSMLRLVWANLLGNAVKFTRTRKEARIEVAAREEKGEIVFSVRDNGVGFDMKYAGKLFGVFQRLHPTEEFEGTGIGLANVQRIIARHGGRTWAEAEPDKGAAFYFAVPK